MVCIVVARNGEGDAWVFGSLPEARLHPIPQMDDVFASDPQQLAAQYGRDQADSLLRFAEGRDRSRLIDALEEWKAGRLSATLRPEAEQLLWDCVRKAARKPTTDPAETVRIVVEDRRHREGRTLRSLPGPEVWPTETRVPAAKKGSAVSTERKTKTADNGVITITTEGGKNPKREGTPSFERFALYKNGMTVAEAKAAGVKAADISYDEGKGFIKVEVPAAA